MGFQEAFPELKSTPPQLPGQQSMAPSALHQLRRQQLHDLARAYGLQVKMDGTKNEILPILMEAESRGVFLAPPVSEWWLRKAARSPDDRGVVIEGLPDPQQPHKVAPVEEEKTHYEDPRPLDRQHIGVLRRKAKEGGMVLTNRNTKEELLAFLEERNAAAETQS